jgi:hypothetical protein
MSNIPLDDVASAAAVTDETNDTPINAAVDIEVFMLVRYTL